MFVSIRGRSCGVANIRNRFLKFARKAYSIPIVFVSIAIYSYWWQGICSDRKIFESSLNIRKGFTEIRQTDRKLRKKFAGIRKKFGSIRNHLKGLTFSVILLGNRIISGEYAANINVLHSQDIRHSVRVAYYSQRDTNDRECLRTPSNIWRSLRLVANCIRKPIRHYLANLPRIYFFTFARIFATVWD